MRKGRVDRILRAAFAAGFVFLGSGGAWADISAPEVGSGKTFYWSGTTDEFASKAANWVDGDGNVATSTPLTTDSIVIDEKAENRPMTWDLDDVVLSSWTQDGYTGTVTFETGETGLTAKGVEQTVHGDRGRRPHRLAEAGTDDLHPLTRRGRV